MDDKRTEREAGGELVSRAGRRLADVWQAPVAVAEVLVAMPEHAVFRTRAPDGGAVVVKADLSARRAAAERAVTAAAYRAGLPVPQVVYADGGVPALLVLRHLPGPALTGAAPAAAWADAGRVLARLHDLPDPGCLQASMDWRAHWAAGRPGGTVAASPDPAPAAALALPEMLAGLAAREAADAAGRGLLSDRQAAVLGDRLSASFAAADRPDRDRVLHGDPQPDHFLLAEPAGAAGRPEAGSRIAGVIDFGDACTGDPVWDLAILTLDNPARLGDVLAGYAPGRRLAGRIRRLIGPYRLLRWLAEANWLDEFGFDPDQSISAVREALSADQGDA